MLKRFSNTGCDGLVRAIPLPGLRKYACALAATLFFFQLFMAAHVARAGIEASVEAREENGFARVVIDFKGLPEYKHELEAGVLVLNFEEPVDADISEIPNDLPEYIGLARRDPDGRAFRLALNRPYLVNLMEAGDQLYVDILPPGWRGNPPPLPSHVIKALSRAASEREREARELERQRDAAKHPYKVDVRMVRHPTFNRIVFDWNRFTTANLSRNGHDVRIGFGAWAEANIAALKVDAPKFLRDAKVEKTAKGMEVVLTVDDDVDIRGFREGLTYVVDLTGPDVAAVAAANKAAETIGVPAARADSAIPEKAENATSLPADQARPAQDKTEPPAAKVEKVDLKPADLQPEKLAKAPVAEKKQDQSAPEPARKPQVAAKPAQAPAAKPVRKSVAAKPAEAKLSPEGAVFATVVDSGAKLRVTFPFPERISAAAFRRGKTVWLVFDSDAPLDVQAIKDAQGGKLVGVQHVRASSMQYLRLELSRAWLTYVSTNEAEWIVDIGDMVSGEAYPLQLQRKLREDKRSLISIGLKDPGRVHWLNDPEIGDRLAVVTAFPPQRSVIKPQNFVEFDALATAHGIAIRPHSDDLAVRLQLDEIIVTRRKGLTLSAGNVHQYVAGRKPLARTARVGFLNVEEWAVKDPAKFSDRIHDLQRAVALASDEEKNAQRFALARLYFSNGYIMEATGVLERMVLTEPELAGDPSFNALRGASLALLGRTAEARKEFEVHALANDPDAALWLGLLDIADRNWESALERFEDGADTIYSYSPELQTRFRLGAARAALWLRQLSRAADELDALPPAAKAPELQRHAQLLRGWYLQSIGRAEEALEAYNSVLDRGEGPVVAEAELRTIGLLVRKGKMTRKEAIKNLERLQLVWRGDDVEIATIRMLASLYVEEKAYREAFTLAKNTVLAFPESRLSLQTQDDMKEVFRDLYLKPGPEGLKPIEALGLFYDFREFTPVGRQGDEIIRRLADRLIEFDLLDQAASLLDHQVNKRLKGAARSQVATRLAMIHLMNYKPELALRTIRQTRQAGLPNEMRRSRNLLEARALGELGRADAAIEILNAMDGDDVERVKADALWSAQQWLKAGQQMEQMLGARWQDPDHLDGQERFNVLRAAIAYSLAGDQFALDRIRKKYYDKMVQTPDAESFIMVTRPVKSQDVSFRELARNIAGTDTLDAFMKSFRERYDRTPDAAQQTTAPSTAGAG